MVESFMKVIQEISVSSKDVKEYVPGFFNNNELPKVGTENIFEPVTPKDYSGFTEFQKEILVNEYDLSLDDIEKYSDWEDFENRYLNKPESNYDSRTPENNGSWEGERGNSMWKPDREYIPPEKSSVPDKPYSNPDNLTWREILDKYGIEGIPFKDGFPDFSQVSKGTVEIEGFETGGNAEKNRNFNKAYIALAEKRGCSPEEVKQWMKENNYTWHECEDKRTMQKVPNEIHANIPHDGGRSQKEE